MDRKIQVSNLPELDGFKREKITGLIESNYDRLLQRLPGEIKLELHYKESRKGGERKLVELRGKAVVAGIKLNAGHADWDAEAATRHVMQALLKEAEKLKK